MTWAGAQLNKSTDGTNYSPVLSTTSGSIIGISQGVLGDFTGGNVFDYQNTVTITLQTTGTLSSYTELQVLNGSGAFALGAHGRWEIIQYKTATLVSAGVYTLSGLLRGRRGTEWAQGLHQTGDKFVLADANAWNRLNPGTAEIGLARTFKAVTFKDTLSNTSAQTFTNSAVGLKPYAPVHLSGSRDGSNNLTINWVRRTRTGGEWRDYVDIGTGEPTLSFDVEVWNSTYTTLLRTISAVTDVTASYTAAEQTADGLTPGNTVYLKVYQISATVGRGYALTGSV
jgi:hypothetical protein